MKQLLTMSKCFISHTVFQPSELLYSVFQKGFPMFLNIDGDFLSKNSPKVKELSDVLVFFKVRLCRSVSLVVISTCLGTPWYECIFNSLTNGYIQNMEFPSIFSNMGTPLRRTVYNNIGWFENSVGAFAHPCLTLFSKFIWQSTGILPPRK